MKRNYFLLLLALACFAGKSIAQQVRPCYTDEVRKQVLAAHPEMAQLEATYEAQIQAGLKNIDFSKLTKRTTAGDSSGDPNFWYDIPIVVHIIHDYGQEYSTMPDDSIYNFLVQWNIVYAGANSDTSSVIPPFKKWIGIPHIRLHLATKDPYGNPSHGITRHRNYLTYTAGEPAKFDDWPPTSYVNIWSVYEIPASGGFQAAAYAYQPPTGATDPYGDGILCDYSYMRNSDPNSGSVGKTINHEMGHVFNLMHPWGNTNFPQVAAGDDDVDDTPPTWGHDINSNPTGNGCYEGPSSEDYSIYDTMFATNYYKIYTNINGGDSLVNYPDTTNVQNIMDYSYCSRMFTKGQVARMHAALNSDLAGRNNLWADTNLIYTGVLNPDLTFASWPDLKPIPEFSAVPASNGTSSSNYLTRLKYFVLPGELVKFVNESWNDTLTSLTWTFSNGATIPTETVTSNIPNSYISNRFSLGGWDTISMTATGNNTGDTTVTWTNSVFVASPTATAGAGYVQTFNPSGDAANWPTFNYYNNEFKWQLNNSVGYGDNYSMEYLGYDSRINTALNIYPYTGEPKGDVDDFFSIPFNLSGYTAGNCYLNFNSSGASRSSTANNIDDVMDIDYKLKGDSIWVNIAQLTRSQLCNKGASSTSYVPSGPGDWIGNGVAVPAAAISPYTVFRFRYLPNIDTFTNESAGNNFYMDNIHLSEWPAAVENVAKTTQDVTLLPNPTNGDAYVVINDANNTSAQIIVSDITGKVVYTTTQQLSGNVARIAIPHAAISVQGVYLVQTITGSQETTKKLVVY